MFTCINILIQFITKGEFLLYLVKFSFSPFVTHNLLGQNKYNFVVYFFSQFSEVRLYSINYVYIQF